MGSHQILLDINKIESKFGLSSKDLMNLLESENIIIDAVGRIGTNEMTRRGGKEKDMVKIAEFIARVVIKKEKGISKEIIEFMKKFELAYCF